MKTTLKKKKFKEIEEKLKTKKALKYWKHVLILHWGLY